MRLNVVKPPPVPGAPPERVHARHYSMPMVISLMGTTIRKADIDRLRRNIKWRRHPAYIYRNDVMATGKIIISNTEMEDRDDLVGCYVGSVQSAQLREDLLEAVS